MKSQFLIIPVLAVALFSISAFSDDGKQKGINARTLDQSATLNRVPGEGHEVGGGGNVGEALLYQLASILKKQLETKYDQLSEDEKVLPIGKRIQLQISFAQFMRMESTSPDTFQFLDRSFEVAAVSPKKVLKLVKAPKPSLAFPFAYQIYANKKEVELLADSVNGAATLLDELKSLVQKVGLAETPTEIKNEIEVELTNQSPLD